MRSIFIPTLVTLLLFGQLANTTNADAQAWRTSIAPIIETHCVECHDGPEAEGGLDLTSLDSDLGNEEVSRRWTLIYDRIATGEMPPEDQTQPTPAENEIILTKIASALTRAVVNGFLKLRLSGESGRQSSCFQTYSLSCGEWGRSRRERFRSRERSSINTTAPRFASVRTLNAPGIKQAPTSRPVLRLHQPTRRSLPALESRIRHR